MAETNAVRPSAIFLMTNFEIYCCYQGVLRVHGQIFTEHRFAYVVSDAGACPFVRRIAYYLYLVSAITASTSQKGRQQVRSHTVHQTTQEVENCRTKQKALNACWSCCRTSSDSITTILIIPLTVTMTTAVTTIAITAFNNGHLLNLLPVQSIHCS